MTDVMLEQPTYFRTATGTRVHLPQCPHLTDSEVHAASEDELHDHPVCDWSQAQLDGYGREHFDTLEDAMRRVGVPVEAHAMIMAALRPVVFDEIFTVHSLTYGALGRGGRTVAGFGKTYYWIQGRRVNLPSYVATGRSGHTAPRAYGEVCPIHHLAMSLAGTCDDC